MFKVLKYPAFYEQAKCANDTRLFNFMQETRIDPFFDLPNKATKEFLAYYCSTCPVRSDCRLYALRTNQLGGWGGETYWKRIREDQAQKKQFEELQEQMQALSLGVKSTHSVS